jgi:2-polyprenyl-6-methoxyphenol hydroxylase-like FAD-dependent oxidoreductase
MATAYRRNGSYPDPDYHVDVVVVGARAAGAATALHLARAGLTVMVVDRARRGSDTLSTHALMRGGVLLLRRWGVLDRVVAAGTPPVRHARFDYGHDSVNVSLRPAAGVDALYAPRRTVLDPILVAAAEAAGARFRFGVAVTDLRRDPTGRVVGVAGRDRNGRPVRITAGMTIGADGARSLVARCAGATTTRTGAGSAVVYGYWSGLAAAGYEWYYRPGATAGLIPTNDGQVLVFAGTTPERFAGEIAGGDLAGGYHRLLKEVTGGVDGRLAGGFPPGRLHAFPGRPSHLRQAWGPGWALVGDAGYFLDPLSTHGITDALRDSVLLSGAVTAIHCGAAEREALAGYQHRRDRLSGPLFAAVDAIASYRWTPDTIGALLRTASAAMSAEVEAISRLKDDA